MSYNDPLEFLSFRTLTPEELLQSQNRQTILTPQEKFARIQKTMDKRTRRLRKYHFVAIETTKLLYVFDGEGIEIGQFDNSVAGCRLARLMCVELFLASNNQNGGYSFSGPNYENLTEEEYEQSIAMIKKHHDSPIIDHSYANNYLCRDCDSFYYGKEAFRSHLCTDNWVMLDNRVYSRNFALESRVELR